MSRLTSPFQLVQVSKLSYLDVQTQITVQVSLNPVSDHVSHTSVTPSQYQALFTRLLNGRLQCRHNCFVKHVLQLVLRQRAALNVFHRAQLLRHPFAVLFPHWAHLLPRQLLSYLRVISQICLCAYDQARDAGTVVVNFWKPLLSDVFEGGRRRDGEADKEHVGLWV